MEKRYFADYETCITEAKNLHGGVCAGIVLGTRMTMIGLERIGITDPKNADRKKLMVFVEIDRCCADAITALTGCRPGKRTMKVYDYGKMAATFLNLETGKAVRVSTKGKRKQQGGEGGEMPDFSKIPEEDLFIVKDVNVSLKPEDMPGKPLRRVVCASCGEGIMDARDVEENGETICRPCSQKKNYYALA
ncbi:MAG: TraR/DksA C4-type zinc finger protein [Deltaproteobacteria bacterium]|nr:TraR/DksA C4-type zinc finger protein [Deltaproteobacteria bacterium]